jgi:hypothetical protein
MVSNRALVREAGGGLLRARTIARPYRAGTGRFAAVTVRLHVVVDLSVRAAN